jgi:hypothetical protein
MDFRFEIWLTSSRTHCPKVFLDLALRSSYNSSRGYKPRGAGAVTSTYVHQGRKRHQRQKAKAIKSPAKKSGNPKGRPHHLSWKRGGRTQIPRLIEVPVRAMSGAVPGTGRSCATGGPQAVPLIPPFGLPPPHAVERMGGQLKDFAPFWRDVLGCTPYALEAVMGFRPHFTSPHLSPCRGRISVPPLRARTITT